MSIPTTIGILVGLFTSLLSTSEGTTYFKDLNTTSMMWRIRDLDEHYLSWNDVDVPLHVFSAWRKKKSKKTPFSWVEAAMKRKCQIRETIDNVTKCHLHVPQRNGMKLTLRLCATKIRCRSFRIEGDDFVDVKYSTELSSMNITRKIPSASSVKLFIKFPRYTEEYDKIEYACSARNYNEKDQTCDLSGLNTDEFHAVSKKEVGSEITKTIYNLKPNTTHCVVLQYKVQYRGKLLDGDVFNTTVTTEPDMNAYILRYGLMIVSFLLVAITVAVIKFFLKPKWKKFSIHIKDKNEKVLNNITVILDDRKHTATPATVVEKYDVLSCRQDREEKFNLLNEKGEREPSTYSTESQETLTLLDQEDSKSLSSVASYTKVSSSQEFVTEPSHSHESEAESDYMGKPV